MRKPLSRVLPSGVRQSGHDISEPVIRRRFTAGRKNFVQHYRHAVGRLGTVR